MTAPTKPQYDAKRAAYLRSREAEKWVAGYVRKMVEWPAPVRKAEGKMGAA